MSKKRSKSGKKSSAAGGAGGGWDSDIVEATLQDVGFVPLVFLPEAQSEVPYDYVLATVAGIRAERRERFVAYTRDELLDWVHATAKAKSKSKDPLEQMVNSACADVSAAIETEGFTAKMASRLVKLKLLGRKEKVLERKRAAAEAAAAASGASRPATSSGRKSSAKKPKTPKTPKGKGKKGKGAEVDANAPGKRQTELVPRDIEAAHRDYLGDEPRDGPDVYVCVVGFAAAELLDGFASCGVRVDAVLTFSPDDADAPPQPPAASPTAADEEGATEGDDAEGAAAATTATPAPPLPWACPPARATILPKLLASPEGSLLRKAAFVELHASRQKAPIDPLVTFDEVAVFLYLLLDHQTQHASFLHDMDRIPVPSFTGTADMRHYNSLMAQLPAEAMSTSLLLGCLIEQVAVSAEREAAGETDAPEAKEPETKSALEAMLDNTLGRLAVPSAPPGAAAASAGAAPRPEVPEVSVLRARDEIATSSHLAQTAAGLDVGGMQRRLLQHSYAAGLASSPQSLPYTQRSALKQQLLRLADLRPSTHLRAARAHAFGRLLAEASGTEADAWGFADWTCEEVFDAASLAQLMCQLRGASQLATATSFDAITNSTLVAFFDPVDAAGVAVREWEELVLTPLDFSNFMAYVADGRPDAPPVDHFPTTAPLGYDVGDTVIHAAGKTLSLCSPDGPRIRSRIVEFAGGPIATALAVEQGPNRAVVHFSAAPDSQSLQVVLFDGSVLSIPNATVLALLGKEPAPPVEPKPEPVPEPSPEKPKGKKKGKTPAPEPIPEPEPEPEAPPEPVDPKTRFTVELVTAAGNRLTFDPAGVVHQSHSRPGLGQGFLRGHLEGELCRSTYHDGRVVRVLQGEEIETLCPDGARSLRSADGGRLSFDPAGRPVHTPATSGGDGAEPVPALAAYTATDPVTAASTVVFEDGSMQVRHPDGRFAVEHHDGTRMYSKAGHAAACTVESLGAVPLACEGSAIRAGLPSGVDIAYHFAKGQMTVTCPGPGPQACIISLAFDGSLSLESADKTVVRADFLACTATTTDSHSNVYALPADGQPVTTLVKAAPLRDMAAPRLFVVDAGGSGCELLRAPAMAAEVQADVAHGASVDRQASPSDADCTAVSVFRSLHPVNVFEDSYSELSLYPESMRRAQAPHPFVASQLAGPAVAARSFREYAPLTPNELAAAARAAVALRVWQDDQVALAAAEPVDARDEAEVARAADLLALVSGVLEASVDEAVRQADTQPAVLADNATIRQRHEEAAHPKGRQACVSEGIRSADEYLQGSALEGDYATAKELLFRQEVPKFFVSSQGRAAAAAIARAERAQRPPSQPQASVLRGPSERSAKRVERTPEAPMTPPALPPIGGSLASRPLLPSDRGDADTPDSPTTLNPNQPLPPIAASQPSGATEPSRLASSRGSLIEFLQLAEEGEGEGEGEGDELCSTGRDPDTPLPTSQAPAARGKLAPPSFCLPDIVDEEDEDEKRQEVEMHQARSPRGSLPVLDEVAEEETEPSPASEPASSSRAATTNGSAGTPAAKPAPSIVLLSTTAAFGSLKLGCVYSTMVRLRNISGSACRCRVPAPDAATGLAVRFSPGPLAPGLDTKLEVVVNTSTAGCGPLSCHLDIVTETGNLTLAVIGEVHDAAAFAAGRLSRGKNVRLVAVKKPSVEALARH